MRHCCLFGLLLSWIVLAGCASTPERRIGRESALFASFPPEVQELVAKGQVRLGFEPDMVRLALGEPDKKMVRQSAGDLREVWYYEGRHLSFDSYEIRHFHPYSMPMPIIHFDHPRETIYTRMQLDFVEGKLVAIEQLER